MSPTKKRVKILARIQVMDSLGTMTASQENLGKPLAPYQLAALAAVKRAVVQFFDGDLEEYDRNVAARSPVSPSVPPADSAHPDGET